MVDLVKNILRENLENKVVNNISDSIFKGLELKISPHSYYTAGEMLEDFSEDMLLYVDSNWGNYFYYSNEGDDDDEPQFELIKNPEYGLFTHDEMEQHMFYEFIEEQKKLGYIEQIDEDYYVITGIYFTYGDKGIRIILSDNNGKIKIGINHFDYGYMDKILQNYGISYDEDIGEKVIKMLLKKILELLISMGVSKRRGMIKFKNKKISDFI